MKTLYRTLLVLVAGGALACTAGSAIGRDQLSGPSGRNARLVVTRSASLGGLPVALLIDGKRVGTIDFNRRYDANISAGRHSLSVFLIRNTQRSRSEPFQISVEGGKTYYFTATREGPVVVLKASRGA